MPQIKYIANGRKTDSINGVGLTWEPGQVRNVSAEMAERLLAYPDTWVKSENLSNKTVDDVIELAKAEKPTEEPLPVINFHGMDKKALIEFAETKYNEKLDKRQSEDTIRHKVIGLFGKHQAETE